MSKGIKPDQLGEAIAQELTIYHESVNEAVNTATEKAAKDLVKKTKGTAPVGHRGDFKRSIAAKLLEKTRGLVTWVWYVKAPNHRLTHLLVRGHATVDGGRTKADPFLHNALDEVLPDYEKAIEEAVKK